VARSGAPENIAPVEPPWIEHGSGRSSNRSSTRVADARWCASSASSLCTRSGTRPAGLPFSAPRARVRGVPRCQP